MSMWTVNESISEPNDVWALFQSHEDVSDVSQYGYLIPGAVYSHDLRSEAHHHLFGQQWSSTWKPVGTMDTVASASLLPARHV
jgi:hypothetical protein